MTLIKRQTGIELPSSEITPEHVYRSRRRFIKGAAALSAAALVAACQPRGNSAPVAAPAAPAAGAGSSLPATAMPTPGPAAVSATEDELGDPLTDYEDIANYNNYYEFTTDKSTVAFMAADMVTSPWEVAVGGLVRNPGVYDVDDLRTRFDQEERIYRLRCVEGWSMVIPWVGFPLHKLLALVEPQPEATHVRFETIFDPEQMPGQNNRYFNWPYVEGLRLDEAMNDLTLLATGLYGQPLPPQNGAPVRLVVPWKYGYKSIKAIVKIDLVDYQPVSLWMAAAPDEYGFYSNVNPDVPHPRWSQSSERRIGELGRRPTLLYNGYEAQVASLYGPDFQESFLGGHSGGLR